ncbi:MAG: hypothetical protein AB7N76_12870 [Planctomycetota bacterium]
MSELLGEVTVPSGTLLVVDCGLLPLWSDDRPPLVPEGILDPDHMAAANAGSDFELIGPDAERAGLAFGSQPDPRFLYDVPAGWEGKLTELFRQTLSEKALDADLRPLPARVPHRTRLERALEHGLGAGSVFFHGLTAVGVQGLPRDRPLELRGERVAEGVFAGLWEHVELRLRPGAAACRLERAGFVAVDWSRILFGDLDALRSWNHDEPRDGLADCVFWGLHGEELARLTKAPALEGDTFGWLDQPVEVAVKRCVEVERLRDRRGLRAACDFRPHSDHYAILGQIRATPTESGTVEVGGAEMCGFNTTWGDGFFPVLRVYEDSELVAVRVHLATEAAEEAMRQVNGL